MNFPTTVLITAAMAMATGANAAAKTKADAGRRVTVYYSVGMSVEPSVDGPARAIAAKMFSNIGVQIDWRAGSPAKPEPGSIVVEFVTALRPLSSPARWLTLCPTKAFTSASLPTASRPIPIPKAFWPTSWLTKSPISCRARRATPKKVS